jgi:arylsulfatase A-like enzyme
VGFALVLAAFATVSCTPSGPAESQPAFNLIVISIDTLRADHVGAYGYPLPTTPHIDVMARDSLVMSKCVAHAPITLASHASIMTSLLPRHHGASVTRKSRLAAGVPTLAGILNDHGYHTASFNGGIQLDEAYGLDRGFDVYVSAASASAAPQTLADAEYRLRRRVEEAIEWLNEAKSPFFVFLHSYEIHHPYTPDEEYLSVFEGDYAGGLPSHISVEILERINSGEEKITEADAAHIIHTYDAELRSADDAVGRLVSYLRENDLYDDTMIVVTSDHGEEFGERGSYGWHAHTLFDELLLVPLIIKFPDSRFAGVVGRSQARGIDVAPTVLAALGIEPPESFAGRDLSLGLAGAAEPPRPAVSMFDVPGDLPFWVLRSGPLKLHWGMRLFDLEADPLEQRNVAEENPRHVATLQRLGFALLNERERPEDVAAQLPAEIEEQMRALGYVE